MRRSGGPGRATIDTSYPADMCRNITTLRGLEPQATDEEIEAAARQYIRKVSGVQAKSKLNDESFERAVSIESDWFWTTIVILRLDESCGLSGKRRR